VGKSGVAAAAGVGTGSGRCGNGQRAVAAAEVGVPLTNAEASDTLVTELLQAV
jgi:hypothetical protein